MITVYVAMIKDRHSEPGCEVFTTPSAAVAYARNFAQTYNQWPEDYEEREVKGWLFYARYSVEDSVWVEEKDLQT